MELNLITAEILVRLDSEKDIKGMAKEICIFVWIRILTEEMCNAERCIVVIYE